MALPGIYRPSRNKGRNKTSEKGPPQYTAEEEATKENKLIQRELIGGRGGGSEKLPRLGRILSHKNIRPM